METVLKENRVFEPIGAFKRQANVSDPAAYAELCREAERNPVAFWEKAARESLTWEAPWTQALDWNPPFAKWFLGGKINASVNCLDRHLALNAEKTAIFWESEAGETATWTFRQLHSEVCRLANALEQKLGLKAGDTAAIYMPLVPEAVIAMLACARIGVTHSVIFAGFSANAIRDRVRDAECKVIFTTDVSYRKGQALELWRAVAQAIPNCPSVKKAIVLKRSKATQLQGPFVDWLQLCSGSKSQHTAQGFDSEHPLFLLYTSGTTGVPKGIVHSTGGYLTGVTLTAKWVLDLKEGDRYWCTADVGWVTGHSYLVYGPLSLGTTLVLYEGALNHPHSGRIWEMIQKYKVSILYTAPTAIRSFMCEAGNPVDKFNLDSLRLLGTVGEPINPEAWVWYHTQVGKQQCPIVDTWWQTETGAVMIGGLPGVVAQKPGSASKPFPGIIMDIVDEAGRSCERGQGGYLVAKHPWPSMLRGIHKNPERFKQAYFSRFPGMYFTGDGAHCDKDGYYWIKGRVDDVLNVSGHRLGTMEIESALVSHPNVAEAAVVGKADSIKGQSVVAFVIPRSESLANGDKAAFVSQLKKHVSQEIGALARPDAIFLTRTLPKTRSGKIMRRLLRDVAEGKQISGDTTTLENPALLDLIE